MAVFEELFPLITSTIAINTASAVESWNKANALEYPTPPPMKVSVIVPAWHEPRDLLEISLKSLKKQNVVYSYPEMFEFIFVGCEGDDLSVPEKLGYKILCAPRGKLKARHLGTESSSGGIIVSADADSYFPPNWLNLMLLPFHESGVVGTTSTTWHEGAEVFLYLPLNLYYSTKMTGRGCAYLKDAYYKVGGFRLYYDELYEKTRDPGVMMEEEEFGFMKRLRSIGKVVLVDAPVVHLGEPKGRGLHYFEGSFF